MAQQPRTPFVELSRTDSFVLAGAALIAAFLIGVLVGEDRGWIAGCAAGSLVALIRTAWPLRRQPWFWAATGFLSGANVFAVAYFDWSFTHSWNGASISALLVIDFAVMVVVIYGLYCWMHGAPAEAIAERIEKPSYSERDLDL